MDACDQGEGVGSEFGPEGFLGKRVPNDCKQPRVESLLFPR